MNIGYLYGFNSYPPQNGGGVHVYNLIKFLNNLGCRIHAFDPECNPLCKTYAATDDGIRRFIDNIDILCIRIDGWYLSKSPLKIRCMEEAGTLPIVWEVNATAQEMLKIKLQLQSLHSNHGFKTKLKHKLSFFKIQSKIKQEERYRRKLAKRVNAAICVSNKITDYAVKGLGISTCKVIPNGSDPLLFSPDKKSDSLFENCKDKFKAIYIGDSKYPWQGFDLIKELAELSKRRGDEITFIALDNASSGAALDNDGLMVFNSVNYFDVPQYVASIDACLCLYHDFSWARHGFTGSSLKLFDYMACEKPVIASRLGQIAEVIEDGKDGLLTDNDLEDVYKKLIFCFKNPDRARKIGKLARGKVIDTYNWERAAKSTLDLFKSLQQN